MVILYGSNGESLVGEGVLVEVKGCRDGWTNVSRARGRSGECQHFLSQQTRALFGVEQLTAARDLTIIIIIYYYDELYAGGRTRRVTLVVFFSFGIAIIALIA